MVDLINLLPIPQKMAELGMGGLPAKPANGKAKIRPRTFIKADFISEADAIVYEVVDHGPSGIKRSFLTDHLKIIEGFREMRHCVGAKQFKNQVMTSHANRCSTLDNLGVGLEGDLNPVDCRQRCANLHWRQLGLGLAGQRTCSVAIAI